MAKKAAQKKIVRDAGSGKFTTKADAKKRPAQTVVETITPPAVSGGGSEVVIMTRRRPRRRPWA